MRYACPINAMPLLNYIGKLVNLDAAAVELILDSCKEVLIPKGHTIFNDGKTARYVYFMVSGKARSYYTDYAGKTITWSFHFNEMQSDFKNLFIVDYKSFLTKTPGNMYIEALTDIRAIRIGHRGLDPKFEQVPVLEKCLQNSMSTLLLRPMTEFLTFLPCRQVSDIATCCAMSRIYCKCSLISTWHLISESNLRHLAG